MPALEYAVVDVAIAPLRKGPDHRKEMVNQFLFGEKVKVLKQKDALWVKVRSLHDDYEGWLTVTLLRSITKEQALTPDHFVAAALTNTIGYKDIECLIPKGAFLPGLKKNKGVIGEGDYRFKGKAIDLSTVKPSAAAVETLSKQWLNAPYLWGGRTTFGVDCSGFAQIVNRLMGIALPRDAWQQEAIGKKVKKLTDAKCGDLAFFDENGKIIHVGILLDAQTIIHASGKVRIDKIDKKGIVHSTTGIRTHHLYSIKRIF